MSKLSVFQSMHVNQWLLAAVIFCGFGVQMATAAGLGNLVFMDNNRNGKFDSGDQGVPGVRVEIYPASATEPLSPITSRTTDNSGRFRFTGLANGSYWLYIPGEFFAPLQPLEYTLSSPGAGGDTGLDDNADENGLDDGVPTLNGIRSGVFVLSAGTEPLTGATPRTENGNSSGSDAATDADEDLTMDFGFVSTKGKIGDRVWVDLDGDGVQSRGTNGAYLEPGLPDVLVELWRVGTDELVDQVGTVLDGSYLFTGVPPGEYYVSVSPVHFGGEGTYYLSQQGQGGDADWDSNPNAGTGRTLNFTLGQGESIQSLDVGYTLQTAEVGNFVWQDLNGNGLQDGGEPGLSGVEVSMYDGDGNFIGSRLTGDNGIYLFDGLNGGTYYLTFANAPAGWRLSNAGAGDPNLDSDPDPATGRTANFLVYSSTQDTGRDAGFKPPGNVVRGQLWLDTDSDGVQSGEPLMQYAGVMVELWAPEGQTPAMTVEVDTGTGEYVFNDVLPGNWQVKVPQLVGDREEWVLTRQGAGDDPAVDSDFSGVTGRTLEFGISNGQTVVRNAGYRPVQLGIGNLVYVDADGDGGFDPGEGVQGVEVLLAGPYDTETELAEVPEYEFALSQETGFSGTYYFRDLAPGWYRVSISAGNFSETGLLAGMVSLPGAGTWQDGQDDGVDENGGDGTFPITQGVTAVVYLAHGQQPTDAAGEFGWEHEADLGRDGDEDLTIDFGFGRGLSVGNRVWKERYRDGIYQPIEGVAGVTVQLFRAGDDAAVVSPLAEVVTGAAGEYLIGGLPAGDYFLRVPPASFGSGEPLEGLRSVFGDGADDGKDDHLAGHENGVDGSALLVAGVRSGRFTLEFDAEPLDGPAGEGGAGAAEDSADDASGDMTIDFAFYQPWAASYVEWQELVSLFSQWTPAEDADGDGVPNLLEYAFASSPLKGVPPRQAIALQTSPDGTRLDVCVTRNPEMTDTVVTLEILSDLALSPGGWAAVSAEPEVAWNVDGTVTECWRDVEALPGAGAGRGFLRCRVESGATVLHSAVYGWLDRALPAGQATLGAAFRKPALAAGFVDSHFENTLTIQTMLTGTPVETLLAGPVPAYLEIVGGAADGQRFEILESASSGTSLVVHTASQLNTSTQLPDLTGQRIILRRHWTIGELCPVALGTGAPAAAQADQILLHSGTSWRTMALLGSGPYAWEFTDDVNSVNQENRPVPPGTAAMLWRRSAAPGLLYTGEVSPRSVVFPLRAGYNFLAPATPVNASPLKLGLTVENGFVGGAAVSVADQCLTWRRDSGVGSGWRTFFLLEGSPAEWVDAADGGLLNQNNTALYGAGRSFFLRTRTARPGYRIPSGWTP